MCVTRVTGAREIQGKKGTGFGFRLVTGEKTLGAHLFLSLSLSLRGVDTRGLGRGGGGGVYS